MAAKADLRQVKKEQLRNALLDFSERLKVVAEKFDSPIIFILYRELCEVLSMQ